MVLVATIMPRLAVLLNSLRAIYEILKVIVAHCFWHTYIVTTIDATSTRVATTFDRPSRDVRTSYCTTKNHAIRLAVEQLYLSEQSTHIACTGNNRL